MILRYRRREVAGPSESSQGLTCMFAFAQQEAKEKRTKTRALSREHRSRIVCNTLLWLQRQTYLGDLFDAVVPGERLRTVHASVVVGRQTHEVPIGSCTFGDGAGAGCAFG